MNIEFGLSCGLGKINCVFSNYGLTCNGFCGKNGLIEMGKVNFSCGCGREYDFKRTQGRVYITSEELKELCIKENKLDAYNKIIEHIINYKLMGGKWKYL